MSRKKVKDLKRDIQQKELEIKELRDKIRDLEGLCSTEIIKTREESNEVTVGG